MLRPGSAGANTTADHLQVLAEAITAVPARRRRRLMVTCDGAGDTQTSPARTSKAPEASPPLALGRGGPHRRDLHRRDPLLAKSGQVVA